MLNRLFGNATQSRHDYFKNQIREVASPDEHGTFSLFSFVEKREDDKVEEVFDYYNAIDGFAIKAPLSSLEEIRAMDGVKNAFVEHLYKVPDTQDAAEPKNQTSLDMIGADQIDQKGAGETVLIIGSGLDVNHEAFKSDLDDSKTALKEDDVERIESQLKTGRNARYVSEKIPFVYDYADNDADAVPPAGASFAHGAHVAGIVGANSGEVRGAAPEAQTMMMKVSESKTGNIPDSVLLAAFDDAVVIKPTSVNVSLGSDAGFSEAASQTYGNAIEQLHKTGATVNIAAGNSYTSGFKNKSGAHRPYVTDPDGSVVSSPSTMDDAFSVASVNNAERTHAFRLADGSVIPYIDAHNDNYWGTPLFRVLADGEYRYVDGGVGSEQDAEALKR